MEISYTRNVTNLNVHAWREYIMLGIANEHDHEFLYELILREWSNS